MPSELAVPLTHNALLSVSGDDATSFLQGQLTNDVESLKPGEAQWNGWCSAKGRLLATFLLVKRPEGYWIVLPAEIAAGIAKRLGMYVLRSKVKIADVTPQHTLLGIVGAAAVADGVRVPLGSDRFVVVAPHGAALPAGVAPGTPDAWDRELIHAGVPVIVAATQDQFVPQMVNFELLGGVSFRKGCYPGQEIVARTQYRGILKRRMALAHVEGAARPVPGQNVYGSAFGDQAAGMVVNAAPAQGGGFDLLVVAQIDSLRAGDLRLGTPEGPALRIVSHPAAEAA